MGASGSIAVLRHACAGDRLADELADLSRPLDAEGRRVADRLPEHLLAHLSPTRVVSSPAVRCVDTVRPLAATLSVSVECEPAVGSAASADQAREALLRAPRKAVVCTHGETMRSALGVETAKGAFWIVERVGDRLVPVEHVDAPPVGGGAEERRYEMGKKMQRRLERRQRRARVATLTSAGLGMAAVASGAVAMALDRRGARRAIGKLSRLVPGSLAALSSAQESLAEASLPFIGPERNGHGNDAAGNAPKPRKAGKDGKSAGKRKRVAGR